MMVVERMTKMFRVMALGSRPEPDMLDRMLLEYDESLRSGANAVLSDATSRRRHTFATGEMDRTVGIRKFVEILPIMMRLQTSFRKSTKMASMARDAGTVEDSTFPGKVTAIATRFGAQAVGFAEVTPDIVYENKVAPHPNAIVVAQRMDNARIVTAPSVTCMVEVMDTYGQLGVLVNRLAAWVTERGYDAVPGPALGGAVDLPSLGRRAGLGEYGRHGLLISPLNGACQRLAAVFTSVRLPAGAANEHGWIWDFCSRCRRCIRECPVGAILDEPVPQPAGHRSCVDGVSCLRYFGQNYGCSICIKVCPFTTTGFERIRRSFVNHGGE
jgi:epoxyqueuosine reductase